MNNSGDLYDFFRSDTTDTVPPYLWSETEVFGYMNDAYRSFVRNIGGVPDVSSAATQIPVVAGQMYADVSPLILRFTQAHLVSTGQEVKIINEQDAAALFAADYGQARQILMSTTQGPVRYMMIGLGRSQTAGKIRWLQVPAVNDTVSLSVLRLPLDTIEVGDSVFDFPDIGLEHIEYLLLHMKARAYGKQDAETINLGKRDSYKTEFAAYCAAAKAEGDRYKHKTRIVAYGGL